MVVRGTCVVLKGIAMESGVMGYGRGYSEELEGEQEPHPKA